ncbi:response regulator transcription factor [Streptomyces sp. NBC_00536]|uniref:response regulator transcription factor n=1 Tax=Streptomyces sp. NBC_00536 TaxID=2975769 RepID=UPI002E81D969|nr:response regulator transcription factor [Streptomyces sp. NBC_00536]WUC77088.1 response regulator transcription factor [Streptomyces sp. NBC_00536]
MVIRVVLADDEEIVRAGLCGVLDAAADLAVVDAVGSGAQALTSVRDHVPDVLVLDLDMPGMDGISVIRRLRELPPGPGILVLTTVSDEAALIRAWRAGADGFLLKSASPADLVHAVSSVAAGRPALAPSLIRTLMDRFAAEETPWPTGFERRMGTLSERERSTAAGVAQGLSNREIAARLGVAEGTVKAYVSRCLRKLRVHNRTQLAVEAGPGFAVPPTATGPDGVTARTAIGQDQGDGLTSGHECLPSEG